MVGAGPAGSACALVLARKGARVLLLEKRKSPGEGTASSGVLYGGSFGGFGIADLVPGFESDAPLERRITSHEVTIISDPDPSNGAYRSWSLTGRSLLVRLGLFTVDPPSGRDYSVNRKEFDPWLADKAVEAGAILSTETAVTSLAMRGHSVAGVTTAHEEILADVVVDCSGVSSTFPEAAGLRKHLGPRQLYQGVSRTYRLGEETIDQRFRLRKGEGKVVTSFGGFMHGVSGNSIISTNRDTVSVGVVASMDSMVRALTERFETVGKPLDILDAFVAHPMVAELIEGGEALGYCARNIPRGPRAILKAPQADGYLVAGDAMGAFVRMGPLFDGLRLAIASGAAAGEAYLMARVSGSYRASNLARYRDMLSPLYEEVARSGRENFFSESGFAYNSLPRLLLSSTKHVGRRSHEAGAPAPLPGARRWEGEAPGESIAVDAGLGSASSSKPWVPSCPTDCFTLVTPGGAFHSYGDLYRKKLAAMGSGRGADVMAYRETVKEVESGKISFDPKRCVSCGTCWALGPPEIVAPGVRPGLLA